MANSEHRILKLPCTNVPNQLLLFVLLTMVNFLSDQCPRNGSKPLISSTDFLRWITPQCGCHFPMLFVTRKAFVKYMHRLQYIYRYGFVNLLCSIFCFSCLVVANIGHFFRVTQIVIMTLSSFVCLFRNMCKSVVFLDLFCVVHFSFEMYKIFRQIQKERNTFVSLIQLDV